MSWESRTHESATLGPFYEEMEELLVEVRMVDGRWRPVRPALIGCAQRRCVAVSDGGTKYR